MGDTFRKQWRIAKTLNQVETLFPVLYNMPYTWAYTIRKQEQLDSFQELPKDKVPPRSIWHNDYKLAKWFETVFDHETTGLTVDLDGVE